MSVAVAYAALLFVPWLGLYGTEKLLDWYTTAPPLRRRRGRPDDRALAQLVDDLRRLDEEYRRVEASDLPARAARLRSLALAYDEVLRRCCRALDLPEPEAGPLAALDRLQTEAALAQRGVLW